MTLGLRYAARSDRGLVRSNNEDSVYAGGRLLALADGMGGHAAGEVASQLVIAALAHLDDDEPGGDLLAKLDAAVRAGNTAIATHVEQDPDLEGMGTTLTAILFADNKLGLVHVGDSRGYLLRDGELTQITKDDTFVQTLVDEGRITAEEAHSHPQRSLIMRALTGHDVEPTLIMREARAGDRYMLCSDGLSDPVSQDTILEALQLPDVHESADRLIELALRGGGPDNVTVVVADVVDDHGQTQPIMAGAVSGIDDQLAPPNTAAGRASAIDPKRIAAAKRVVAEPESPVKRPRPWRRIIIAAVLLIVLLAAGLIIGFNIIRSNYYIAAQDGTVSIMRGMPGYPFKEQYEIGCVNERHEISPAPPSERCQPLRVDDLDDPSRQWVLGDELTGKLDDVRRQMRERLKLKSPAGSQTPTQTPAPPPPSSQLPTSTTPAQKVPTTGTGGWWGQPVPLNPGNPGNPGIPNIPGIPGIPGGNPGNPGNPDNPLTPAPNRDAPGVR